MSDQPYNNKRLKLLRRDLRTGGTPAEGRLWTLLKNKQVNGLRFRRQHSIDRYILDFYCPEVRLCIELDGQPHKDVTAADRDYHRTLVLQEQYDITVLRYENRIVFENPDLILYDIEQHLQRWRTKNEVT